MELQWVWINLLARCIYQAFIYFGGTSQKKQFIQLDAKPGPSYLKAITLVPKSIILATYISLTLFLLSISVFFFVKGDMKLLTCFIFHRPILINMNFVTPVKFFIKSPATDIYFFYLLLTLLRYYQNFVLCWVFFPILWSFPNNSTHMMYSFSRFFFFNILLKYAVMGSIYSPSYSDIICPFSRYWAIIFWRHHCMTPFCLNYGEICV